MNNKPGIGGTSFKLEIDKDWFNQNVLSTEKLTIEEILEKYILTDVQIEILKEYVNRNRK